MKRPDGVTVLSILLLILSFFMVLLLLLTLASPSQKDIFIIIQSLLITTITLGVGIGMLRGKKWSWWVGVCFLSILFMSCVSNVITNSVIIRNTQDGNNIVPFFLLFFLSGSFVYYLFNQK